MKVTVHLTIDGAKARKAHLVGCIGSARILSGFGCLLQTKERLQAKAVEQFQIQEATLPEWSGDLKERAAVGMGHRKAFARFIEKVEVS